MFLEAEAQLYTDESSAALRRQQCELRSSAQRLKTGHAHLEGPSREEAFPS